MEWLNKRQGNGASNVNRLIFFSQCARFVCVLIRFGNGCDVVEHTLSNMSIKSHLVLFTGTTLGASLVVVMSLSILSHCAIYTIASICQSTSILKLDTNTHTHARTTKTKMSLFQLLWFFFSIAFCLFFCVFILPNEWMFVWWSQFLTFPSHKYFGEDKQVSKRISRLRVQSRNQI